MIFSKNKTIESDKNQMIESDKNKRIESKDFVVWIKPSCVYAILPNKTPNGVPLPAGSFSGGSFIALKSGTNIYIPHLSTDAIAELIGWK
ncbi:MAG: hypothetical protein VB101_04180 [Rhodospirillaceae bacterium]|nr:hypothetical protein [Rhodospirillaceae bacterium]